MFHSDYRVDMLPDVGANVNARNRHSFSSLRICGIIHAPGTAQNNHA